MWDRNRENTRQHGPEHHSTRLWGADELGAATVGIAEVIGVTEPRHAIATSVLAGALAIGIPHLRRAQMVEP